MPVPSRRILVGYVATAAGRDALNLGIALAAGRDAELHVTMVAPEAEPYAAAVSQGAGYERVLRRQLQSWLDEALASVPEGVRAVGHVVSSSSDAEGLLSQARAVDAEAIVIGARAGGVLGRYRIGSVAQALLHSSHVPVVLAPRGYSGHGPLSRITALFGDRPGGMQVIAETLAAAEATETRVRLVTFAQASETGKSSAAHTGVPGAETMKAFVLEQLDRLGSGEHGERARAMISSGQATTEVVAGKEIEKSVRRLDWEPDEVVVVGSSRLAPAGRAFLGSHAARVLRAISVPMVVVPAPR
ncbi:MULTISPECIES: universal stress protein [Micrococcaceae]|uniref:UspA domain-containing protein n=2 Tax=Pseudoglutamicibacter albus TaxID=98671 RepID=A0A096AGE4_9MICC|nr:MULTISPECIES: universal stress protein [Micrococcaceae]KGF20019.1 hypothetical protein HMPREF2128_06940 [Pseudoglutamicibacter albus DNF00011]MDR7292895.1 nucleotide-binding universal stress UspA family protein [Pseudoglutamicibacter albus]OFT22473.1 hypothetical protein HMPREF3175_08225 [Arthrobacter sp. HMSC08H08]